MAYYIACNALRRGARPVESSASWKSFDPSLITNLATGYWASMVLLTANRYEVFNRLADSSKSAVQLASECGVQARSLEMLLNASKSESIVSRI